MPAGSIILHHKKISVSDNVFGSKKFFDFRLFFNYNQNGLFSQFRQRGLEPTCCAETLTDLPLNHKEVLTMRKLSESVIFILTVLSFCSSAAAGGKVCWYTAITRIIHGSIPLPTG